MSKSVDFVKTDYKKKALHLHVFKGYKSRDDWQSSIMPVAVAELKEFSLSVHSMVIKSLVTDQNDLRMKDQLLLARTFRKFAKTFVEMNDLKFASILHFCDILYVSPVPINN